MKYKLGTSYHTRYIYTSLFFLSSALGLIGTQLSLIFLIFTLPIIGYIPELIHYKNHHAFKSHSLNYVFFEHHTFLKTLKFLVKLGFITGVFCNILIQIGYYDYSGILFTLSLLWFLIISFGDDH